MSNIENKPITVLQICAGSRIFGGVERMLYSIYRHIDKEIVQFDFLSPAGGAFQEYQTDIEKMGGHIYDLGAERITVKNKLKYNAKLFSFLKKHKYDIVHINSGVFLFCLQAAVIARITGTKRIIVHSHSNYPLSALKTRIIRVLQPLLRVASNEWWACSVNAAAAMFSSKTVDEGKVRIVKNGIELEKFKFDSDKRKDRRAELLLQDQMVYGYVARFDPIKNHDFLVDVFRNVLDVQKNAALLFVGSGEMEEATKSKVRQLGLEDKVFFLGNQTDVGSYLCAMDCFCFPSFSEGLPLVAVEAQASGLPVFCSENIPQEACISKEFHRLFLDEGAEKWASKICSSNIPMNDQARKEAYKNIISNGFDICDTVNEIQKAYVGLMEEK